MYDEFFSKAHELIRQGIPFATAIVVRAERPTSGKPGDKAIITADGTMHGWIGGSCAQPTVIREALSALRADESRFVRLSPNPLEQVSREGLDDVPMTCFSGGTLEIYIEPQQPQPRLIVMGIMAEIVQRRRNSAELAWIPAPPTETQPQAAPATAIDPICGMSVEIAGAKHKDEYQGTTYYFCCPGCKTTFRKAPEQYVV